MDITQMSSVIKTVDEKLKVTVQYINEFSKTNTSRADIFVIVMFTSSL